MPSDQCTPPPTPSRSSSKPSSPASPWKNILNGLTTNSPKQKDPSKMPKGSVEVVDHSADAWTFETKNQGDAELHTRTARLNFTIAPPTSSDAIQALCISIACEHSNAACRILRAMPYVHPAVPYPSLATEDIADYRHGVHRDTSSTFNVKHTSDSSVQIDWQADVEVIDPSHPVPELRLLLVCLSQARPVIRINYKIDLKIRNIDPSPKKRLSAVFNRPCEYLEGNNYLIQLPKGHIDPTQLPQRWVKLNPQMDAGSDRFKGLGGHDDESYRGASGNGNGGGPGDNSCDDAAALMPPSTRPFTSSFATCEGLRTPPFALMQQGLPNQGRSDQDVPRQELPVADEQEHSDGEVAHQGPHREDDVDMLDPLHISQTLPRGPYGNYGHGYGSTVSALGSVNDADVSSNGRGSVSMISVSTGTADPGRYENSSSSTVLATNGSHQKHARDIFS